MSANNKLIEKGILISPFGIVDPTDEIYVEPDSLLEDFLKSGWVVRTEFFDDEWNKTDILVNPETNEEKWIINQDYELF
mgnify:CR=1 FL=1